LAASLSRIEEDRQAVHKDVALAQQGVWKETMSNFKVIGNLFE